MTSTLTGSVVPHCGIVHLYVDPRPHSESSRSQLSTTTSAAPLGVLNTVSRIRSTMDKAPSFIRRFRRRSKGLGTAPSPGRFWRQTTHQANTNHIRIGINRLRHRLRVDDRERCFLLLKDVLKLSSRCRLAYTARWGGNTVRFESSFAYVDIQRSSVVRRFYTLAEETLSRVDVSDEARPLVAMVRSYLNRPSSALWALETTRPAWVEKVVQNKCELMNNLWRASEVTDDDMLLALLTILRSTVQRAERLLPSQVRVEEVIPFDQLVNEWEGKTTGKGESPSQLFCLT